MDFDVLVVGANTAGTFFAAQMAKQNYKVLVIDKLKEQGPSKSFDVVHLEKEVFQTFGLETPVEGDMDFITVFNQNQSRSALNNYPKKTSIPVYVLHFQPYLNRLRTWAEGMGVTFQYESEFVKPLYNDEKRLCGATIKQNDGEEKTIFARLVADASGIPSVVRRSLSEDYGIEKFEIGPKDKFYVVLRYVQLQNGKETVENCGWPYFKTWLAPQHHAGGAILGIGANYSFDYANECFKAFEKQILLPSHSLQYIEQGTTPWCRPPYSFVADGFVALGDAACLTRPWNGEGIRCGLGQGLIAAQVIGKAMEQGVYPTQKMMWEVNMRYQKDEGAQYAALRAILPSIVHTTAEENDWLFENSIMFKDESDTQEETYTGKLIMGVLKRKIKLSTVLAFLKAAKLGQQLTNHYQHYPQTPGEAYTKWVQEANALWAKAPSMAGEQ